MVDYKVRKGSMMEGGTRMLLGMNSHPKNNNSTSIAPIKKKEERKETTNYLPIRPMYISIAFISKFLCYVFNTFPF